MMFRASRYVLYTLLFAFSSVLLGLTAYRVHYTKSLSNGDILTSRSHFYDPRIVALMVASIISLIFSIAVLGSMMGTSVDFVAVEHISLWVIWIFFLITAALVTDQFSNLKYCRSHNKVCRILETIKAFSWMCWGILSILLLVTLIKLLLSVSNRGTNRNARGAVAAYPDTRQTTAGTTVHDQPPRTQATQGAPTAHGTSTKLNANQQHLQHQQPQHQSMPTTTTAPGALYQQDIDHPTEPRHLV